MAWFDIIKDPGEYYTRGAGEMTASEVAIRHAEVKARMVAMDAATSPPLVIPSAASWVGAAAGISSAAAGAHTSSTGTTTRPTIVGFGYTELEELQHLLTMNDLELTDLREIVDTYCRVKRRVEE